MSDDQVEILWQDDSIAVINKPANLIMHSSAISADRDTLIGRLRKQFENPPIPVHRLDRPVSGAILGAYDKNTAAELSKAFREGRVHKTYIAIVRGQLKGEGEIDIPLKHEQSGEMLESRSRYRSLQTIELPLPSRKYPTSRYSLVAVSPLTGRFHQLRRHLARIGYPIVGDSSHGDTYCNHQFENQHGIYGLLLHSARVTFSHPFTGKEITVYSPLRENMRNVCDDFNWPFSEISLT